VSKLALDLSLEDWFFAVKNLRPALEAAALEPVVRRQWLRGMVNPHHPEPYFWHRGKFSFAKPVAKPKANASARKDHDDCGFDDAGRLCHVREYHGDAKPSVELWLHLPGEIRQVRYSSSDEYLWEAPEMVKRLTLDSDGRVVESESYANLKTWPDRALKPADIRALKARKAGFINRLHYRFAWKNGLCVSIDGKGTKGWRRAYEIDHKPDGKPLRVWQVSELAVTGRRVVWGSKT
jgi:hypothetical protein